MGVTATRFTALPTGQVPVVGGTVVAGQTYDIWQTLALSRGPLANTVRTICALTPFSSQEVTGAL